MVDLFSIVLLGLRVSQFLFVIMSYNIVNVDMEGYS